MWKIQQHWEKKGLEGAFGEMTKDTRAIQRISVESIYQGEEMGAKEGKSTIFDAPHPRTIRKKKPEKNLGKKKK